MFEPKYEHETILEIGKVDPHLFEPLPLLENLDFRTHPVLTLRASGIPYINDARRIIHESGLEIDAEISFGNIEKFARYLYPIDMENKMTYLWFMLSRRVLGDKYNIGHTFILNPRHLQEYERVKLTKYAVREYLGLHHTL